MPRACFRSDEPAGIERYRRSLISISKPPYLPEREHGFFNSLNCFPFRGISIEIEAGKPLAAGSETRQSTSIRLPCASVMTASNESLLRKIFGRKELILVEPVVQKSAGGAKHRGG